MARKTHLWMLLTTAIAAMLVQGCGPSGTTSEPTKVKVAAILPLTGPNAAIGTGMMNSADLAVREANKTQALGKGVVLELVRLDDGSKPEQAVALAKQVGSDPKVLGVIAHYNSPCALAASETYHRSGVPALIGGALASDITKQKHREILRVPPNAEVQASYLAKYLVNVRDYRRIYILDDGTAWGRPIKASLKRFLADHGSNAIGEESYKVGDKDFSALLTKVKNSRPDAVVICGVSVDAGLLRSQMVRLKVPGDFIGVSGVCTETFLTTAGSSAEGARAIYVLPPVELLDKGPAFEAAYKAAGYKDPPEVVGIYAYAEAQVLIEAMRRAAGDLKRETVLRQLREGTFETAVGSVSFDERGENRHHDFAFYIVKNGRWQMTHREAAGETIKPATLGQ